MPDGRLTLPFGLRSGKLGTPWERMQSEYATPCAGAPAAVVLVARRDDPQALLGEAVLVVAAPRCLGVLEHVLVTPARCKVEILVGAQQSLDAAVVGGVRVVHHAVLEREGTDTLALRKGARRRGESCSRRRYAAVPR